MSNVAVDLGMNNAMLLAWAWCAAVGGLYQRRCNWRFLPIKTFNLDLQFWRDNLLCCSFTAFNVLRVVYSQVMMSAAFLRNLALFASMNMCCIMSVIQHCPVHCLGCRSCISSFWPCWFRCPSLRQRHLRVTDTTASCSWLQAWGNFQLLLSSQLFV